MRYVTVEREIPRRPEVVWEALVDVAGFTSWVEGLVEARARVDAPLAEATVVDLTWRADKKSIRGVAEVTGFRPNVLLAVETRIASGLFFDRASLEATPHGTRIEIVGEVMSGFGIGEYFARQRGLLGAPNEPTALEKAYERSIEAFAKRVAALSAIPYR